MSSVDERVVDLKFNNAQFESGVQQSMGTLEKLKQSLNFSGAADGLKGLKNAGVTLAANGLGSVSIGLDTVKAKFSALGIIGDEVLRRMTDSVINFGKNLITAIPNQIISGGKKRAQNIEQAQFMLKGLMKEKYDWDVISKDLDYAVSGTAYGLDAAAKVASQLKASNIEFGSEMQEALRGVSGVAAMTGSSYEDIGRIFTTIAGQGRMMTDQLNQFAGRGLNVAADLAKYYKTDEKTLREMVTKGKVDFKTFAKAMNEAYGEQATKANDTFAGSLSNVKASLSRMGAQFATPSYEALRRVFNALLPVMKKIEKVIKPLSAGFTELSQRAAGAAEKILEVIGNLIPDPTKKTFFEQIADHKQEGLNAIEDFKKKLKGTSDAATGAADTAESVEKLAKDVINGMYGTGEARRKALEKLGYSYEEVQNKVNELLGVEKRYEVAKKSTKDLAESTKDLAESANFLNPDRLTKIATGFAGIGAAINIIKSAGSAVYDNLIKPLMETAGLGLADLLVNSFGNLGSALISLDDYLREHKTFDTFTKQIADASKFVVNFGNKFKGIIKSIPGVQLLAGSLKLLVSTIKDWVGTKIDKISDWFYNLWKGGPKIDLFGDKFQTLYGIIDKVGTALSEFVTQLAIGIKTGDFGKLTETFDKIKEKLEAAKTKLKEFTDAVKNLPGVKKLGVALKTLAGHLETILGLNLDSVVKWIKGINNASGETADNVNRLQSLYNVINSVTDALSNFVFKLILGTQIAREMTFAEMFQQAAIKIANFFKAIGDLSGVQILTKTIGRLVEIFKDWTSLKFDAFVDWLHNIDGSGFSIIKFYNLINKVTMAIAGFIMRIMSGNTLINRFADVVGSAFSTAFAIISNVYASVKNFFNIISQLSGVKELTQTIKDLVTVFKEWASVKLTGIANWLKGLGEASKPITFMDKRFRPLFETINKVTKALSGFIRNMMDVKPITTFFSSAIEKAKTSVNDFFSSLNGTGKSSNSLGSSLGGFVKEFLRFIKLIPKMSSVKKLGDTVKDLGNKIKEASKNKITKIIEGFKGFKNGEKQINATAKTFKPLYIVVDRVSKALNILLKVVPNAIGGIAKFLSGLHDLSGIKVLVSSLKILVDTIKDWASAKIDSIKEWFKSLDDGSSKIAKLYGIVNKVTLAIAGFILRLINGRTVFNSMGAAVGKAGESLKKVWKFIKEFFQITSALDGVKTLGDSLQRLGTAIKEWGSLKIDSIKNWFNTLGKSGEGVTNLHEKLQPLYDLINNISFSLSKFIDSLLDGTSVFHTFGEAIRTGFDGLLSAGNTIGKFFSTLSGLPAVKTLGVEMKALGATIKDWAGAKFKSIGEWFKGTDKSTKDVSMLHGRLEPFFKVVSDGATALAKFIHNLLNGEKPFGVFGTIAEKVTDIFGKFSKKLGGGEPTMDRFAKVAERTKTILGRLKNGISDAFGKIKNLDGIKKLGDSLKKLGKAIGELLKSGLKKLGSKLSDVMSSFSDTKTSGADRFYDLIDKVAEAISKLIDKVLEFKGINFAEVFSNAFESIKNFKISDLFGEKTEGKQSSGESGPKKLISHIFGTKEEVQAETENATKGFLDGVKTGLATLGTELLKMIKIAPLLNLGLNLAKFILVLKNGTENLAKIPTKAVSVLDALRSTLSAFQMRLKAQALKDIAIAIGIVAASIFLLSRIPSDALTSVVVDMAVLGLIFVGLSYLLAKIKALSQGAPSEGETNKVATTISSFLDNVAKAFKKATSLAAIGIVAIGVGVAIGILVSAFLKLTKIDFGSALKGGIMLAALIAVLVVAVKKIKENAEGFSVSSAVGILLMVEAINVLVGVVKKLGGMDIGSLVQGGVALAALMFMLSKFSQSFTDMAFGTPGEIAKLGGALIVLALAMTVLFVPIMLYGSVDWTKIAAGIVEMALALLIIGGIGSMISEAINPAGVLAILGLSAAVLILAPAVIMLGAAAKGAIIGIGVMAIALGALIALGYLAAGAGPGLMVLTGALAGLSTSLITLSIGIGLFSIAIAFLAQSIHYVLGVLPEIGSELYALGGSLIDGLGAILSALGSAIAEYAPKIILGFIDLIKSVGSWIMENGWSILVAAVTGMVDGVLGFFQFIVVDAGPMIKGAFEQLMNSIKEVFENRQVLFDAISSMTDSVMAWILQGLYNILGDMPVIGGLIKDALDGVQEKIQLKEAEGKKSVEGYTEGQKAQIEEGGKEAAKTVEEANENVNKAMMKSIEANAFKPDTSILDKSVNEAKQTVINSLGDGSDIADKTKKVIENAIPIDAGTEKIKTVGENLSTSFLDGFGLPEGADISSVISEKFGLDSLDPSQFDLSSFTSIGEEGTNKFLESLNLGDGDPAGAITEAMGLNGLDFSGVDLSGFEGMGTESVDAYVDGIQNGGTDFKGIMTSLLGSDSVDKSALVSGYEGLGGNITQGLADGVSNATDTVNSAIQSLADNNVISTFKNALGIHSPSTVFEGFGNNTDMGYARGVTSTIGIAKAAVTSLATASLAAIAAKVPLFKPYGASAGTYYALGILSKKSAATAAGSSIASASVDGAKSKNASAKGAGIGLGDKMVDGVKSREDAAYKAGARLAEKAIQGFKDKWKKNDPTKDLSNIAPTGNSPGVVRASKDAYSAGSKIGGGAVEGLKKAVEIAKDILEDGIDINPTITPVLDLSQIQNGVGALNGLISPSTINLGRLNASINASRGSDDKVVDAINSLKAGMKPTGDTYIIEGITYDDGSNVSDAVRTLVTAARKKRRA